MTLAALAPIDRARLAPFLAAHGWADAQIVPLAGDASFRRYFRATLGAQTSVLMDAPPAKEDVRPFLAIGQYLAKLGISVPEVIASDAEAGLVLLEDFGDELYARALETGHSESELYMAATDVLTHVHAQPAPDIIDANYRLPRFSDARLLHEVELFCDWYWPFVLNTSLPAQVRSEFRLAWNRVWPLVQTDQPHLVQMDFHSPNLMWLPQRQGLARVGVLDFQDATLGAPAYDVVSLTQDPRRFVSKALEAQVLDRYLSAMHIQNPHTFRAAYAVLGAQRATRILGQFVRLCERDAKPHYLAFQPRVWEYWQRNLSHPALAPVRCWFDAHIPDTARAVFWEARA
jgi:N-acetylmuramate 1-kinase